MIDYSHSRDFPFVALGFSQCADGTLCAPTGSTVTFIPIDRFYRLTVALPGGAAVTAVLAAAAIKVVRS
jgi:hypothetical protein